MAMNRTTRRFGQIEKKIDTKLKGRGDSKTIVPKTTRIKKENITNAYPDGDARDATTRQDKQGTNLKLDKEDLRPDLREVFKPKLNTIIKVQAKENKTEFDEVKKKIQAKEAQKKAVMELKRIRQKYAMKVKASSEPTHQVKREGPEIPASVKSDIKHAPIESTNKHREHNENDTNSPPDPREDREPTKGKKKPLIKTVHGKNGLLPLYTAVTFVEDNKKRTVLDINIPNPATVVKINPSKCTDTSSLAPSSVTPSERKHNYLRRKSPRRRELKKVRKRDDDEIRDLRDARSPTTEVAKWAPASVSQETKPYYEAWVSTRLAAVSKHDENDDWYLHDKVFLNKFKKAMERPATPDLFYENFADERYTGRIKIRQK